MNTKAASEALNLLAGTSDPEGFKQAGLALFQAVCQAVLDCHPIGSRELSTLSEMLKAAGFEDRGFQDFRVLLWKMQAWLSASMWERFAGRDSHFLLVEPIIGAFQETSAEMERLSACILPGLSDGSPESRGLSALIDWVGSAVRSARSGVAQRMSSVETSVRTVLSGRHEELESALEEILARVRRLGWEYQYFAAYELFSAQEILPGLAAKLAVPDFLYRSFAPGSRSEASGEEAEQPSDPDEQNIMQLVYTLSAFAEKAGREGLLSLEDEIHEETGSCARSQERQVLVDGVQLIVDGTHPRVMRRILLSRITALERRAEAHEAAMLEGLCSIRHGLHPFVVEQIVRSSSNEDLCKLLVKLAKDSRNKGFAVLKKEATQTSHPILKEGLKMIASGIHPDVLRYALKEIIRRMVEKRQLYYSVLACGLLHIQAGVNQDMLRDLLGEMYPFNPMLDFTGYALEPLDESCKKILGKSGRRAFAFSDSTSRLIHLQAKLSALIRLFYRLKGEPAKGDAADSALGRSFEELLSGLRSRLSGDRGSLAYTVSRAVLDDLFRQGVSAQEQHALLVEAENELYGDSRAIIEELEARLKAVEARNHPTAANLGLALGEDDRTALLKELAALCGTKSRRLEEIGSQMEEEAKAHIGKRIREITGHDLESLESAQGEQEPEWTWALMKSLLSRHPSMLSMGWLPEKLVRKLRDGLFRFVDIVFLDDWVVRALLAAVSTTDISLSIRTASEILKNKILSNLSEEAAALLDEVGEPGPVRIKDVEAARDRIVDALLLLAAQGKISIEGVSRV